MNNIRIINADVMEGLARLEDESVNCVVTSPPYWGLRDYGTAEWDGGDPECDHLAPDRCGRNVQSSTKQLTNAGTLTYQYTDVCGKCGSQRVDKQIGIEATVTEFIDKLGAVFAGVHRVLRKDGTMWVNMGDCYAGGGGGSRDPDRWPKQSRNDHRIEHSRRRPAPTIKPKDLVGQPWRLAFALQEQGWYLRQDIIWHKPNPMPESITDRCTKAHEYIFLLTKSAKYCYDAKAIAEPASASTHSRGNGDPGPKGRQGRFSGWDKATPGIVDVRNARSVWTILPKPYKKAHFATFPEQVAERCIKAGCPPGGVVLDPFGGAGTTGLVAAKLGRDAVLIELNPEYAKMAEERIAGELPLMATVERD